MSASREDEITKLVAQVNREHALLCVGMTMTEQTEAIVARSRFLAPFEISVEVEAVQCQSFASGFIAEATPSAEQPADEGKALYRFRQISNASSANPVSYLWLTEAAFYRRLGQIGTDLISAEKRVSGPALNEWVALDLASEVWRPNAELAAVGNTLSRFLSFP